MEVESECTDDGGVVGGRKSFGCLDGMQGGRRMEAIPGSSGKPFQSPFLHVLNAFPIGWAAAALSARPGHEIRNMINFASS